MYISIYTYITYIYIYIYIYIYTHMYVYIYIQGTQRAAFIAALQSTTVNKRSNHMDLLLQVKVRAVRGGSDRRSQEVRERECVCAYVCVRERKCV